jgi:predicted PurR-regulated permease PerM
MPEKESSNKSSGIKFIIALAAFVIVVAGMREAKSILVPFIFALFISVILYSPFSWLTRRGIPRALALLLIIIGILGVGTLMITLIGTSVNQFSQDLPVYEKMLENQTNSLINWLSGLGIQTPQEQLLESISLKEPLKLIGGIVGAFSNLLSKTFLILIIVVFMLLEYADIAGKLQRISLDPENAHSRFARIDENIKRYVGIKTLLSLATGGAITLFLLILGIPYPFLWGLMAFLLNYIPNIGSILAAIPAILIALILKGIGFAALTAAGYLVANFIFGTFLEPRYMGKGLGLSTLVVFISLIFWAWVLGPVGMLISVPLTMVVKIGLESYDDTRWIAVLLGSSEKKQVETK